MKFSILKLTISFALGSLLTWSYIDYKSWTALGEGGLPHHVGGWLTTTFYRMIGGDSHDQSGFVDGIGQPWDIAVLDSMPKRKGQKPHIAPQPVPHRQVSQINLENIRQMSLKNIEQFAIDQPDLLAYELSHTERHNKALWVADREQFNPYSNNNGEIAHVHVGDGSVHAVLSPSDAKTVMDADWGELHPLSAAGFISNTYMLIYAPRTEAELGIVNNIIKAAYQYATLSVSK